MNLTETREKKVNHYYFQSQQHFYNYVFKIKKDHQIDDPFLTEENVYLLAWVLSMRKSFRKNLIDIPIDTFTKGIKEYGQTNVFDEFVNRFNEVFDELVLLKDGKINVEDCVKSKEKFPLVHECVLYDSLKDLTGMSDVLKNIIDEYTYKPGIYFLYDVDQKLIYIGKSVNIGNRMAASIDQQKAFFFQYILTQNDVDAHILEPYFIAMYKPPLNREFNSLNAASFEINHGYEKSQMHCVFEEFDPYAWDIESQKRKESFLEWMEEHESNIDNN